MELANQRPFLLHAKLLRILICVPLFKALAFKLFHLLSTLVCIHDKKDIAEWFSDRFHSLGAMSPAQAYLLAGL